jgi:CheY-like chemotaxis protein
MNRVLIIDSSETDSFMLRSLLQVMGHSVEVVTNIREARARLSRYAPHIVICSQSQSVAELSLLTTTPGDEHDSPYVLVALSDAAGSTADRPILPPGFHCQLTKPIEILQLQELMDGYSSYVHATGLD